MRAITLRAHFDGEHIRLDDPFELQQGTPLAVTVCPDSGSDPERESWLRFSQQRLEDAYGEDEPEYPSSLIKEPNPDYEGR